MAVPVPVSLLTGFLGSGKTTLLNRLLKEPALADTAVVINEFGEVAIDHLLVERASDGVIELSDGCVCCTVRGELVDTLLDLARRMPALKRVIVETTGLADPAPVLQSLMAHPGLLDLFRLDGVIATVDAVNGDATLDRHEEAVRQVHQRQGLDDVQAHFNGHSVSRMMMSSSAWLPTMNLYGPTAWKP